MNENFNVNDFLKKNNAIFEYLRDEDGFKIGVIIAVPGDNEPKIGYVTFDDMEAEGPFRCQPTMKLKQTVGQFPAFRKTLANLGADVKFLDNVEMPYTVLSRRTIIRDMNDNMRKKMLIKARRRANYNRADYYAIWEDDDESFEDCEEYCTCKRRKQHNPSQKITSKTVDYINERREAACFRKQVRKFEYRALRYYKYIPGYKENNR